MSITVPVVSAGGAKSTVTLPNPVVTQPLPPTPTPTPAMFVGDYSTGNFAQWPSVQNKVYNGSGRNYVPSGYYANIVNDPKYGKACRYEVRAGDNPGFSPGTERSQVGSNQDQTGGTEGQTRWYRFAVKFDANFPKNHRDIGFGITNGWHPNSSTGSSAFQWGLHWENGKWSLLNNVQSAPGVYVRTIPLFHVSLGTNWHEVKMQVLLSTQATKGFVRLWYNGVRQKFLNGQDTYYCSTLIPGTSNVYYKEGYYRQSSGAPPGILYCAAFRCGATESAVG